MTFRESAPAKVNLVLQVGGVRQDGLHALCSLFASVTLADEVVAEGSASDLVECPGVEGPNLAAAALEAFRAAVPARVPPLRVTIEKRIPVAGGLGGGSADAAAVLRIANALAGRPLDADGLRAVAARLGSDVPSQVEPAHAVVSGVGEEVERVDLPALALVLVPAARGLATGDVYSELDRLRSRGAVSQPARLDRERITRLAAASADELAAAMENDLEPAALSLRPELAEPLAALRAAGALAARVTGSGPTAFGVFRERGGAEAAAATLTGAIVTETRA
jgi:4-diphosphocytidyl-2-C-methyl-D-erythritol kinase